MWKKIKNMFKKKKQKDAHIEYNGADIVMKPYCGYKIEPDADIMTGNELPSNMKIHAKFLGRRVNKQFAWDVNGVVIEAEDILEAHRKYLRQIKQEDKEG